MWTVLALAVGLPYVLWLFFLAVMNLKRARDADRLGPVAYALGTPVLIVGYLLDFLVNVTACTVLFLEVPRETTVTARLKRHAPECTWRGGIARWMAAHLLDAFDPAGRHI